MCGYSRQHREASLAINYDKARVMKNFYIFTAVAVIATVVAVLFVPGVDDYVERTFQVYLGRAAR